MTLSPSLSTGPMPTTIYPENSGKKTYQDAFMLESLKIYSGQRQHS